MKIAIASGKGGTGKTTFASSLVNIWNEGVYAVDLDVEEPNLHLFLKPEIKKEKKVYLQVPEIDKEKCISCGKCAEICRFKAIISMAGLVMTFNDMCHSCGGCFEVCPTGAIKEAKRELGFVIEGSLQNGSYIGGRLRIGEAMSPPLMREIIKKLPVTKDIIIDAPPGTSCPAMASVSCVDYILFVVEPTAFGLNDLSLAYEAFKPLGKKMGAVINKANIGSKEAKDFLIKNDVPILAEIPYDDDIAKAYSNSSLISDNKKYNQVFLDIKERLKNA